MSLVVASLLVPATAASGTTTTSIDASGASGFLQGADHNAYAAGEFGDTPTRLWSRWLPGPVSYAVVDDGRAFATVHGWLFAFSLATGRTLWKLDVGDTVDLNSSTATIVATDGALLVSDRPDGGITAYDERSGAVQWHISGLTDRRAYAAIVAPGNGLFYADEQLKGRIEAHRVSDGSLVWAHTSANGALTATATTVYAPLQDCGGDEAMDAQTGAMLWQSPAKCGSGALADAQSVVAGGDLYDYQRNIYNAETGASEGTYIGDVPPIRAGDTLLTQQAGVLAATDANTGTPLWTFDGDPGSGSDVTGRALVVGTSVFAVTTEDRLYKLDLADGGPSGPPVTLAGPYAGTNPGTRSAMSYGDGELLVPTGNYLTAFVDGSYTGPSAAPAPRVTVTLPPASAGSVAADYRQDAAHDGTTGSGALKSRITAAWTTTLHGYFSYPLIANGLVYVTHLHGSTSTLDAFSTTSGARRWSVRLPTPSTPDRMALPVYDDGTLFVANSAGQLDAVNATTGRLIYLRTPLFDRQPTDIATAPPVAYHGTLYLTVPTGYAALRESDAKVLWATTVAAPSLTSPAVTSHSVYSAGCTSLRLSRATGKLAWLTTFGDNSCFGGGLAPTPVHDGHVWNADTGGEPTQQSEPTGKPTSPYTTTEEPALTGSVALLTADGALCAEDIATHRILWDHSRSFVDAPVVSGHRVYDVSSNGRVIGMRVGIGSITYESKPYYPTSHDPDGIPDAPAAADGLLAVPEGDHLVAFRNA